jgi:hypothetical protein
MFFSMNFQISCDVSPIYFKYFLVDDYDQILRKRPQPPFQCQLPSHNEMEVGGFSLIFLCAIPKNNGAK